MRATKITSDILRPQGYMSCVDEHSTRKSGANALSGFLTGLVLIELDMESSQSDPRLMEPVAYRTLSGGFACLSLQFMGA